MNVNVSEILNNFEPYSQLYGSGNVKIDLLICVFVVFLLIMGLCSYLIFGRRSSIEQNLASAVPAEELLRPITELRGEVKKVIERQRGDTEFVKQELMEIRETLTGIQKSLARLDPTIVQEREVYTRSPLDDI